MEPMEAESVAELPRGAQWQYEPKWDGFRCLLIRDGQRVRMQSKGGRDLARYFPEIASAASDISAGCFILDGELIIQLDEGYSFDAFGTKILRWRPDKKPSQCRMDQLRQKRARRRASGEAGSP
jgi:ATP-dependent DNA ligase